MPARPFWIFFLATLLLAAMHATWAYNQLPESVATHFDAGGTPDGWSSRSGWAVSYVLLISVMAGLFVGLVYLLPRLPPSTVSLPNRDYWLAPERRADTYGRLGTHLLIMGAVTNLFNVGVMHLTVTANRQADAVRLGGVFWVLFGAYMLFVVGWAIWLFLAFRAPAR
jgi:uncharacterized membrane protein